MEIFLVRKSEGCGTKLKAGRDKEETPIEEETQASSSSSLRQMTSSLRLLLCSLGGRAALE